MTTVAEARSVIRRPPYARILVATAVAAATSAGLNAALQYLAVRTFDIPQPQFEPLNLSGVVISSIVGAGAGGLFFALLARLTHRPIRVFLPVAVSVLALSMVPVLMVNLADPPQYEGAGAAAATTLALMHIVVAAVLIGSLLWALRRPGDERMSP